MSAASELIQNVLRPYGLTNLTDWAMRLIQAGTVVNEAQLKQELRATPEFNARFPAIKAREALGLPPLGVDAYLEYEARASKLVQFYDMPFQLSPSQIGDLLASDVSMEELDARIQSGYGRVASAPQEVRDWFSNTYGVQGDAALAATFIDPDLAAPELMKRANAAEIGGTAARFGIGMGRLTAESVALQGFDQGQAGQVLGDLAAQEGLFREGVTESKDLGIEAEGVAAAFGLDAESRKAVTTRSQQRESQFGGAGEAVGTQEGIIGLGSF